MLDFLFDWLPHDSQSVAKQGAVVLLIVAGALLAYGFIRRAVRVARERGKIPAPVEVVVLFFARYTLIVTALLMSLQRLGILVNAWGVLSAVLAMVAIGFFAVWSVLSNLMSTLFLLVSRPFRVGDMVEIFPEALKGRVVDLSFTFTTLLQEDGDLIRLPNNQFLQKAIRIQRGEDRVDLSDQLVKDTPAE